MNVNYKDKEWLKNQLEELGSGRAISEKFGIGKTTVAKWLKKFELSKEPKRAQEKKYYQNREWLEKQIEDGKSDESISFEIGISKSRLLQIYVEESVFAGRIRQGQKEFRSPDWLKEKLEEYGNITEIAKATGHDRHIISKYLKQYGIYEHPTYTVNSNFFQFIDTEEKAYWLGFLMADSTMLSYKSSVEKKYSLSLKLSLVDKTQVENFKSAIGGNAPVHEITAIRPGFKDTYQAIFKVNDQVFCKHLLRHGIVERRTGKKYLPESVPLSFIPHFIRGYFDGDGSIRYQLQETKNGNNKYIRALVFACSKPIQESILQIYKSIGVSKDAIKIKEMKDCNTVSVYRKDEIPKIVSYLYNNSSICLDRKYQIAKNYLPKKSPSTE